MLHIEPVKKKRKIPGIAVSACVLAAALAALVFGVRSVADRTEATPSKDAPLPAWNI